MKIGQISSLIIGVVAAFMAPTATLAAEKPFAAGEWDTVYYNNEFILLNSQTLPMVYSGGGNFMVKVTNADPSSRYIVRIFEEDEAGNPSEFIDSKEFSGSDSLTVSTAGRVDGSNGKAEIRVIVGKCNNLDEVTFGMYD